MTSRSFTGTAAGLALAAVLAAGCSSGTTTAGSSSAAAAPALAQPAVGGGVGFAAEGAAADAAKSGTVATGLTAADQSAVGQHVVRTVQVTLQVETLQTAAAKVRQAALDVGGFVANETTGYAPTGPLAGSGGADPTAPAQAQVVTGESVIVLRVPVTKVEQTLARITTGDVGTELARTSSAQDVTGDVADLTSRVSTQRASVARVRELLAKAADLKDVVVIEGELSRREADLEAIQARLASLKDRADLSTLTVTLRTPNAATGPEGDGFWGPLRPGWTALKTSISVLVSVIGALFPFAVAFALCWYPVRWAWRRWGRRGSAARATGPSATGPTPPPGR